MGESNSKPQVDNDFLRNFERDYKEIGEELDNRLGNVKVFQNGQGDCVATKNAFAQNKEDIENFLSTSLAKALNINCKYLAKLHSYKIHTDDSMCGSVNGITTYHQYFQNTVQDELIRRNQVNLYYQEQELWAILYSIISASAYLETNKHLPLSDVRPCNVYFTPRGEVKLMPFGIHLEDETAYSKYHNRNEEVYLSPEQLKRIRLNQPRPDGDQYKSDIYAIGMTMLMSSTLQTSPVCYNFQENVVLNDAIEQLFTFSKVQYSKFFNNIIAIMLSENPEDRPTPATIHSILLPFEAEILSLRPFNPDYETVKQSLAQAGHFHEEKVSEQFPPESPVQGNLSVKAAYPQQTQHDDVYQQQVIQQQQLPNGQYEYLLRQPDGQPIPQIEQQYFYPEQQQQLQQQPQYVSQQPESVIYQQPQQLASTIQQQTIQQQPVYVQYQPQYQEYPAQRSIQQQSPIQTQKYVQQQPQYYDNAPIHTSQVILAPQGIQQPVISQPQYIQSNQLQGNAYIPQQSRVIPQQQFSQINQYPEERQQYISPILQSQPLNMVEYEQQQPQQQQYNFAQTSSSYQHQYQEPESPIGLVSAYKTDTQSYQPTSFHQRQPSGQVYANPRSEHLGTTSPSQAYDMSDINRRINEALQRTQDVINNSSVNKY